MLTIDLAGKRALVAGVADDGGFGFAIAKALAEAGASICVGTWPPALKIFTNLLERGKMDESRRLASGKMLEFERVYPLDAAYDTLAVNPRYKQQGYTRRVISASMVSRADRADFAVIRDRFHSLANGRR